MTQTTITVNNPIRGPHGRYGTSAHGKTYTFEISSDGRIGYSPITNYTNSGKDSGTMIADILFATDLFTENGVPWFVHRVMSWSTPSIPQYAIWRED